MLPSPTPSAELPVTLVPHLLDGSSTFEPSGTSLVCRLVAGLPIPPDKIPSELAGSEIVVADGWPLLDGPRLLESQWALNSCWLDAALPMWSSLLEGMAISFAECSSSSASQPDNVLACWHALQGYLDFFHKASARTSLAKARSTLTGLRDDLRVALARAQLLDWQSASERDDLSRYVSGFHNDHVSLHNFV